MPTDSRTRPPQNRRRSNRTPRASRASHSPRRRVSGAALAAAGALALIVVAVAGFLLTPARLADGGTTSATTPVPASSTATQAPKPAATAIAEDPHVSGADCKSCHEPPAKRHFSADCASCHSPERPFDRPQLKHVTFGAHTSANQPCSTCHTGKSEKDLACRACHGMKCGKDSKTVGDCLKCHKSGTTKKWVPKAGVPAD